MPYKIARLFAIIVVLTSLPFVARPAEAWQDGRTQNRRQFQDLWIPPALSGKTFDLSLANSTKSFWSGATTKTMGFNGAKFWGPTLILEKGEDVVVNIQNNLDEPTTVHWHGLHLPAATDGGPHQMIAPGATWKPSFKVKNNAGTYWYHPHPHELTQKQMTLGAGGFIIIKDPIEAALNLPRTYGVDDLPLVLTSRRFLRDDQFSYNGDNDKYGDFQLTNGTLDAQVGLPAQFVRLRILNAEIERGYIVGFSDNRTFYQIATDGGLIDKPLPLKRIRLMVGERAEILVNLGDLSPGSSLNLMAYNSGQSFGFPGQEPDRGGANGSLLNNSDFRITKINVVKATETAVTSIPEHLTKNRYWTNADITNKRTIRVTAGNPGTTFSFDNQSFDMHMKPQRVRLGETEAWTIVNNQVFGHSFHIHDVQFKLVARSGSPVEDFEQGWKDTAYIPRNQSITFIAKFEDYASETDPFMYHCHMSNHEDGGMMGQFVVVNDPSKVGKTAKIEFRKPVEHPLTNTEALSAREKVKTKAPVFELEDTAGVKISLAKLTTEKPVLLFFIDCRCPCSRDAAPFFAKLQSAYASSCTVVGVTNSTPELAANWKKELGIEFPVITDQDLEIISAYRAERSVYATVVAPGGAIEVTHPGYNDGILSEISATLARLSGVAQRPIEFVNTPVKIVAGCPFPKNPTVTSEEQ